MIMKLKDLVLTFREDINISYGNEGEIFLQNEGFSLDIKEPSGGIRTFIQKLGKEGSKEDEFADMIFNLDGINGITTFYYYLERFTRLSIICRTIYYNNTPFATLEPISLYSKWEDEIDINVNKIILSRFALIRRDKNRVILESPLSYCRIILHDKKSLEIIHFLHKEKTPEDIFNTITEVDHNLIITFLAFLLNNKFLVQIDSNGNNPEEKNEALCQWEFHDLLFHNLHRSGRHNYPHGGVFPFLNKIEPAPPFKKPMTDKGIDLFKPDMERLMMEDYPFTLIMEERKSIRSYNDKPINLEQLGEFLYRTYRIKEVKDYLDGNLYEITERPCAGGGACYELELYPVINKCKGLSSGIYHYDALNHKLHQLTERNDTVEMLLIKAYSSAAKFCIPEVLIIITARFHRLTWKYRGMAYAAILKNVGALYQNMYLVATAMELAPCALGSGDAELLCRATGLDYLIESPVGEFILGSKRI